MSELENFIPLRRKDVINSCAPDWSEPQEFREFSQLLLALLHHRSLEDWEALKDAYAPFNPDRDTLPLGEADINEPAQVAAFKERLENVLLEANYERMGKSDLERAFNEASLLPLKTEVDLEDFDDYGFYCRGSETKTVAAPALLKKKNVQIENLQRVVVFLWYKNQAHFDAKPRKERKNQSMFVPGKVYLYLYKNVPRNDLEVLFPNVKISMTWKDRMMFAVPAAAGLGPLVVKVLPSLGLLAGVILLATAGPEWAATVNFDTSKATAVYPIMIAALSTSFMLGGFAVKQYLNYKNKLLKVQKRVVDTLFFKNLVTNRGVLFTVVDSAEEELGKEIILAYHHLKQANQPLSKEELDERIEGWVFEQCGRRVDFNVDKALRHLSTCEHDGRALVTCQSGYWSAVPLAEAEHILDRHWDALYDYGDPASRSNPLGHP